MSGRALAGRVPDVEAEKGRVSAAPVQRYWPGKAPEWYKPDEAAEDEELAAEPGTTAPAPPVVLKRADDPRLRRLAQACRQTVQVGYVVLYIPGLACWQFCQQACKSVAARLQAWLETVLGSDTVVLCSCLLKALAAGLRRGRTTRTRRRRRLGGTARLLRPRSCAGAAATQRRMTVKHLWATCRGGGRTGTRQARRRMRKTRRRWRRGALPCASGALCSAMRKVLSVQQPLQRRAAVRERCALLGFEESAVCAADRSCDSLARRRRWRAAGAEAELLPAKPDSERQDTSRTRVEYDGTDVVEGDWHPAVPPTT